MENQLTENQIQLSNGRVYNILPVKVKYMLSGYYGNYMALKQYGLVKLLGFGDGKDIVVSFLTASLDSEELSAEVFEDISAKNIKDLLRISKKLNELQDEEEIKNVKTPMV